MGVAVLMGLASLLLPSAGWPPVVLVPILVAAWLLRGLALPYPTSPSPASVRRRRRLALQGRVNATSRVLAGLGLPGPGLSCRPCAECTSRRRRS